jgi:hypothetical protein
MKPIWIERQDPVAANHRASKTFKWTYTMLNLSQLSVQVKQNAVVYKNIGNYFPIDIISGGYGAVYMPAGDVSKALCDYYAAIIKPGAINTLAPKSGNPSVGKSDE